MLADQRLQRFSDHQAAFEVPRPRILQSSLLCDPVSSMESRLGWQRAVAASRHFETTVLLSELSREAVHAYAAEYGSIPGLHFEFVPFEPFEINNAFVMSYRNFYRDYHRWQLRAYETAQQLHRQTPFSLTHQIGICGYREPGYLWKLDIPFIWGPFGGTQNFPPAFLGQLSCKDAVLEITRAVINNFHLRFRSRVRSAVQRAAKIYAANSRNQVDFWRIHRRRAKVQLETGIQQQPDVKLRQKSQGEPLRILWSGRFKPWKGLPLLLQALRKLGNEISYELRLIGYQSCEDEYRSLVKSYGIDTHVKWLGWPKYEDSIQHYRWADVFAFTSLRDTSGTGLLEALSCGCPIVGLKHQGARDIMTRDCAVRIDVTTPSDVISAMRNAFVELAQNPIRLFEMSKAALERAKVYSWERLGNQMVDDYRSVIETSIGN